MSARVGRQSPAEAGSLLQAHSQYYFNCNRSVEEGTGDVFLIRRGNPNETKRRQMIPYFTSRSLRWLIHPYYQTVGVYMS